MENLSNLTTVKKILARHDFKFTHSLGQNFIINEEICPKMAKMSGTNKNVGVIEIGPGIGILTKELAKISKKVVSIEIDSKLIPVLQDTLASFSNIEIINKDILKIDLKKLIHDKFKDLDVIVCANLPYYITSPIIMKLLEDKLPIKSITVMVQKEVADRICAGVSHKNASAFSATINYYCDTEFLFNVKKDNFIPVPKVDSAVIKLNILRKSKVSVKNETLFFKVIKAAFLLRRKTILNSLSSGLNLPKENIESILTKANIPINSRAENLSLEQFASITNILTN